MQKKKVIFKVLGSIFYILAILMIGIIVWGIVTPDSYIDNSLVIKALVVISSFSFLGVFLFQLGVTESKQKKIVMTVGICTIFIIYLCMLYNVLFGEVYSRGRLIQSEPRIISWEEYTREMNVIPFRSIHEYVRSFMENSMSKNIIITNLVGNFIMMMPFAVMMFLLFKRFERWSTMFIFLFGVVVLIEIIQQITRLGTFDVDDIILNTLGGMLAYAIVKNKYVKRLLHKLNLITYEIGKYE